MPDAASPALRRVASAGMSSLWPMSSIGLGLPSQMVGISSVKLSPSDDDNAVVRSGSGSGSG